MIHLLRSFNLFYKHCNLESTGERQQKPKQQQPPPPQHSIHIISSDKSPQPTPSLLNSNTDSPPQQHQPKQHQPQSLHCTIAPGDNYSYVQLTAVHDYNYPIVDEPVSSVMNARRDSTCSLKKRSALDMPSVQNLKEPTQLKNRLRCR